VSGHFRSPRSAFILPGTGRLPQQKIFHDEFTFAPLKRAAASTTDYLTINNSGPASALTT